MSTITSPRQSVKPTTPPVVEPIVSRLPNISGRGLTGPEALRLQGAENRARAAYAADVPEADFAECHRVGRLAAKDELRRLLKDRPPAPCCDSIEDLPCVGCSSVHVEAIPGADPSMSPAELEELVRLNAENPSGATEADPSRFPAWTSWPEWTSGFYWSISEAPEPEPEVLLTLAEMVEFTARRFRALDNGFGT